EWTVPAGNYSRIVGVAMLVGWMIKGFGHWRFGKATGAVRAFLAFFVWSVIMAALAPNQDLAWGFVTDFLKIVLPVMVGITMIDTVRKLYITIWVITFCSGYICVEFNLQHLSGNDIIDGWGSMGRAVLSTALVMTTVVAFFLGL